MSITTDPNQLIIAGLIFLVGLLVGIFLTAGGRRKWKSRYESEVSRREELVKTHAKRESDWTAQEKEWRERDSLRAAAAKTSRDPADDRPL
jgi:predicted histidine transporter YuiF (NhaC family)